MNLNDLAANSCNYDVMTSDWILEQTRGLAVSDIFDARSWLLAAKFLFPRNFLMFFEAYKLECNEGNIQCCSALLSEMFQQFSHESVMWNELEYIINSYDGDQKTKYTLKQEVFESIPPHLQQKIITSCAERQTDIAAQCKMTLVLVQKYPEAIVQYGIPFAEKLVDEEKLSGEGTPLNRQRKLLVCELLPVICNTIIGGVSHKHFYKWLQKAAEFYAVYFTSDTKLTSPNIETPGLCWDDLDALRRSISKQCQWNLTFEQSTGLQDRMNIVKEIHRKSHTDLTEKINKKQIFYTTILLLIEAAVKYMEILQPQIYQNKTVNQQSYVILSNWKDDNNDSKIYDTGVTFNKELSEYFHVARDAWTILHSNESFDKDFSHLYRRWKMERWVWLQLFLADQFVYDGNHESAIRRLNRILEQDASRFGHPVLPHCICQLVSCYKVSGQLLRACRSVMDCLGYMQQNECLKSPDVQFHGIKSARVFSEAGHHSLVVVPLNFSNLLPFWVLIFIESFVEIVEAAKDDAIGHLIVLSQYAWPDWQEECRRALDLISNKSKFCYTIFFDYVICIDILEEVTFLQNNADSCELVLLPDAPMHAQRVTRGTNRVAGEDFKKAMKRQIKKSGDCMESLLYKFLIEQHDSILNCLQARSSEEKRQPMGGDVQLCDESHGQ